MNFKLLNENIIKKFLSISLLKMLKDLNLNPLLSKNEPNFSINNINNSQTSQ